MGLFAVPDVIEEEEVAEEVSMPWDKGEHPEGVVVEAEPYVEDDEDEVEPEAEEGDFDEGSYEIEAEATGTISNIPENLAGVSVAEVLRPAQFEGHDVAATSLTVQAKVQDLPHVTIDDRVRVVVEMRVTEVSHKTDSSGNLIRVIKAKQDDAFVAPFTEGEDDGVIRSR